MNKNALRSVALCLFAIAVPAFADTPPPDPTRFDVPGFQVEGSTLLKRSTVAAILTPFGGPGRSAGDIERAAQALEAAYHKRGFTLVKVVIPEQELTEAPVHLSVIEPHLGKVLIAGNTHHSDTNIRRSLPHFVADGVPNTNDLTADVRMANENPAKKITPQLELDEASGRIDAAVQVTDEKSWTAGVILDNSGVDLPGRTHLTAQYENSNLWGLDHVFSLQYTTSTEHPSDIRVYGAGYHIPLYGDGDSLDFYGSYSDINSGSIAAGLVDLAVSGAGTVFGAHITHELPALGRYTSQLGLGIDRKAYRNVVNAEDQQLGGDVTVDPVSLSYVAQWALPIGNLTYYLTGVRNVPGGSNAGDAEFTTARAGATPHYGLLRYGAGFNRTLPREWLIRLALNGQATHDALIPGEQFGVGGAASVRGLQERDLADDSGLTATAEIYTPDLCGLLHSAATHCTALGFVDDGHLSRNQPLADEPRHESVSSTGMGFRLTSGRTLSLQMDYGQVFSTSDSLLKGDRRLHALIGVSF